MEIGKKELKEILKGQRIAYERHLGVLSESFESQVKLVAESVMGIQRQLISIREMVAKNTEDIEVIKMDIHIIKDDLKEKVGREEFRVLEKRLGLLEKKFQRV